MNCNRENLSFDELINQRRKLDERINNMRSEEGRMDVGGTHFSRELDICRRSDYTIHKITGELVDNIIKEGSEVNLKTILNGGGYLSEYRCSDNKDGGFKQIRAKGTDNPMNFTHMRTCQNDDNCLSQNGRGLKGGAASSCEKLIIYTNSNNNDKVKVVADFPKMAAVEDCNESYNPRLFKISGEEFKSEHGGEIGSTIILENIRRDMYKKTTEQEITGEIYNKLSETYTHILRKNPEKNLTINSLRVLPEKDYFEEKECKPLNILHNMFRIETNYGEEIIVEEKDSTSSELLMYNKDTGHYNKMKPREIKKYGFDKNIVSSIKYIDSFPGFKECIRVQSTNVMYHPDFNNGNVDMPKSRARLTMSDRRYGNWNKEGNNGSGNYIDIEIYLATKKIAGEIGLTWNKEIANKQENDIAKALHVLIKERITHKLNCDTSTPANKKLYEIAIQNSIIVPESRIPTTLRQEKKIISGSSKKSSKKLLIEDESDSEDENSIGSFQSRSEVNRQPIDETNTIISQLPIQTMNNENIVLDVKDENEVIESNNNVLSSPNTIFVQEVDVEEEVDDIVKIEEKVEPPFTPCLSKACEVIRKTLTILQGKETLENIKKHTNGINFDQEITKILIDYHDRCARDQVQRTLNYVPFKLKCDILMDFINERYRFSNEESEKILRGSELFDIYEKLE